MKLIIDGAEIRNSIFSSKEIDEINKEIDKLNLENTFGIREILLKSEKLQKLIANKEFTNLIKEFSKNGLAIKSIYFDKPPSSNWIVNWHQDLTINLKNKIEIKGFKNWRNKSERITVQPSIKILENIITFRIHLDNCTKENGALRIVPKSHIKGEIQTHNLTSENVGEIKICEVQKGGVLIMKPLTLHSSKRTENEKRRRILHIEITNSKLPESLKWKESVILN